MLTTSGRGTPQSNARTRADEDQKGIVLGRMVELNTSLVCLDISRMKLTDDDAAHLIRAQILEWKERHGDGPVDLKDLD